MHQVQLAGLTVDTRHAICGERVSSPETFESVSPIDGAVLAHVAKSPTKVVFLCFGKPALKMVEALGTHHPIVAAPHPSPLNGKAFVEAVAKEKLFTKVNSLLDAPLDWSL